MFRCCFSPASSSNASRPQNLIADTDHGEFSYFDTGVPVGGRPYETYILIHGLAHNKSTWRQMLEVRPKSVRLVGFSLRGYDESSSFEKGKETPEYEVGPIIGRDFIAIVKFVLRRGVLDIPGSSLSILAWSLGAASVIAAYGAEAETSDQTWKTRISKVIFYEPAGGRAFGLVRWFDQPEIPPGMEKFTKIVAGYYKYPRRFLTRPSETGAPAEGDTYKVIGSILDQPAKWDICQESFESGPFKLYASLLYERIRSPGGSSPTESLVLERVSAFVLRALGNMASTGVRRIHCISTKETLPGCVMGAKWLNFWMNQMAPGRYRETWIPGHHNHFIHNLAPKVLWAVLMEDRVTLGIR